MSWTSREIIATMRLNGLSYNKAIDFLNERFQSAKRLELEIKEGKDNLESEIQDRIDRGNSEV